MTLCSLVCSYQWSSHVITIYSSMALQPFVGLWLLFSFLIFYMVGRTIGWGISLSQGCYIHIGQHKHRINTHRHPCLKWNLNSWSPAFEVSKTVHALDSTASVISMLLLWSTELVAPSDQGNTGTHLPYQCHTPHDQCTHEMLVPTYITTKCDNPTEFSVLW
jgi:hypothetical protein